MNHLDLTCRFLLATVFLVAGASKLRGPAAADLRSTVLAMGVRPRALAGAVAAMMPAAEGTVVVLLAVPVTVVAGYLAAAVLLLGFTAGITTALRRGQAVQCRCFGTGGGVMSRRHVARNMLLVAVAAVGLATHLAGTGSAPAPAAVALSAAVGAIIATAVIRSDDLAYLLGRAPHASSAARR